MKVQNESECRDKLGWRGWMNPPANPNLKQLFYGEKHKKWADFYPYLASRYRNNASHSSSPSVSVLKRK
jgi:hypothetical protein